MWFGRDQFYFVWKHLKGDFILRARAEFVGKGADAHRKLGWMVRPTLDADAPYADTAEHGDGLTSLQFRTGEGSDHRADHIAHHQRQRAPIRAEGEQLYFLGRALRRAVCEPTLTNLDLGEEVYAGLFLCAHRGSVLKRRGFRTCGSSAR